MMVTDFTQINQKNNEWGGNLKDFTWGQANIFFSYGTVGGIGPIWNRAAGYGQKATVVFQSEDFFTTIKDADLGLDLNNLSPNNFGFVENFLNGQNSLDAGVYTAADLTATGESGFKINGTLYDSGSIQANGQLAFTVGSYSVEIADQTTFHVTPSGNFINNFAVQPGKDNFDYVSSNVNTVFNGTLFALNMVNYPFGIYQTVDMEYAGSRSYGTINSNNADIGYQNRRAYIDYGASRVAGAELANTPAPTSLDVNGDGYYDAFDRIAVRKERRLAQQAAELRSAARKSGNRFFVSAARPHKSCCQEQYLLSA